MERVIGLPASVRRLLIDELFCGGNALALLGASLCEPYAGAAAVLVDELDRTIFDAAPVADKFYGLSTYELQLTYFRFRDGFRKRRPSPVPFSSMNSIPADSNACRMAASFAAVTGISPSITSTRRIVATPTFDARARSSALHRSIARAARICALEILLAF